MPPPRIPNLMALSPSVSAYWQWYSLLPGAGFGGAAGEIDGAVEVSEGVVDAGEPEQGFGVVGVVLQPLLGDAGELAVVSLLEQRFAVGGKGEGGGKENKQQHRAETKGWRHRTSCERTRAGSYKGEQGAVDAGSL